MKTIRPLVLALLSMLLASCGWWTDSKTAAAEKGAAEVAKCAAEKFMTNPDVTPEQLAAACGPLAVIDAGKILVAFKRVAAPRVGVPPCGSSSAPAPSAGK